MLSPIRCAVLVSGSGSNLQALLGAKAAGKLPSAALCLVISDREGAYALERARTSGVKALCLPRKQLGQETFEEELLAQLLEGNIQLVVLAGFLSILSPRIIAAFPNRILNIHPSLIPAFCGAGMYGIRVHQAALDRGVKISGATVHLVNEVPDGGPILLQQAVAVLPGDTAEELQQRIMEQAEWTLLPRAVEELAAQLLQEGTTT